ncbi:MAG: EVE domain-containing protein [Steroidobacteraceae bacterium]
MQYWLMKSEPQSFGIDDLAAAPGRRTAWDGVRNYQARNYLRDAMKRGDRGFFYHSSCAEPGIVGIVEVVREGYADASAFDPDDHHYDPKSDPDQPRWYVVDVRLVRKLRRTITLDELRKHVRKLDGLLLLQRGNRLSITPVSEGHWQYILKLE